MSKFIVVEGLIGVGKTTLCRILEKEWGAQLVLEPVEDNPFLALFYSDRQRYAFPTQMFYLATRSGQQVALQQRELFHDLVVSDYLFLKDRLFAEETLETEELALYDRFADLLGNSAARPDFVVFLESPTDVILQRIEKRAIQAEQVIEASYLEALRQRYYALWDRYDGAPVYVINTAEINYVEDPAARERILSMMQGWLDKEPIPGSPEPYKRRNTEQMNLF